MIRLKSNQITKNYSAIKMLTEEEIEKIEYNMLKWVQKQSNLPNIECNS